MRRFSVLRFLILATSFGAAACANDPFAARRETPRMGAAGWVVADPVADPVEDVETRAPEYADGVRAAAQALDIHVDLTCIAPRSVAMVGAETLPASDTALLELNEGPIVTRERVAVTACGRTRLHAVYPAHHPPGLVVFLTGVPGASIASLGLQRDVVAQIISQAAGIIAASLDEGVCDATENEPWVLDTELAIAPDAGVWEEAWTLQACGIQRRIQVRFEETATGVRFSSPITLEES